MRYFRNMIRNKNRNLRKLSEMVFNLMFYIGSIEKQVNYTIIVIMMENHKEKC